MSRRQRPDAPRFLFTAAEVEDFLLRVRACDSPHVLEQHSSRFTSACRLRALSDGATRILAAAISERRDALRPRRRSR